MAAIGGPGIMGPNIGPGVNGPGGIAGGTPGIDPFKKGGANPAGPKGAEFKQALEQAVQAKPVAQKPNIAAPQLEKLKFSTHAVERMRSRGINFRPEEMQKIEGAIAKAAAKGAKDTLVLSGENALIVSVKNHTVVTVMDRAAMKDNVFTNIDSTVMV